MVDKLFVIDMQNHFIPSEALKLARKTEEYDYTYSIGRFIKAYERITNIEGHLEWMERSGVDMAILSIAAFVANGYDFCRACNDGYGEVVKKYPEKFKGMIHVFPYDDKEKNRDEIKRGVEELGLWGIGVVTSFREMTIDSTIMDPIYQAALQYDMPVYVHPTIRKNIWGGEKFDLFLTASREYDIAKSFVEIIYGVLPRFPELKVIMPHLAGGLPALLGRFLAKHQPEDFPIPEEDAGQWIPVHRAEELGLVKHFKSLMKNICFDTAGSGGWAPIVKFALEVLGPDHLCFGTDYPYDLNDPKYVKTYIEDIHEIESPEESKEQLLGGNLKRLFHIK
ncbi:MAG: amidohydrolase family protein [Pseudomonadota bacterium]